MSGEDKDEAGSPYAPKPLKVRDPLHDKQLLQDLAIINERTQRELGPLPAGGLPAEPKRKPKPRRVYAPNNSNMEDEAMKFSHVAAVAAVAAIVITSTLAACEADGALHESNTTAPAQERIVRASATVANANQESSRGTEDTDSSIAEAKSMSDVPDSVLSFIKPGDTLLAYKTMDLTGDGKKDHVIVVRHTTFADKSGNVCDLLVLHEDGFELSLAGRNSAIVDCEFNEMNMWSRQFELNQNIKLSAKQIEFINDNPRGGYYGYLFGYADGKWSLRQATSAYKEDDPSTPDIDMHEESASYPNDFGSISLSDFEPKTIEGALRKHKSLVK
jgi:hypothetical protein